MYTYLAHGLEIHSVLRLPELTPVMGVRQDVRIDLGKIDHPLLNGDQSGTYLQMSADEACFFWRQVGAFLVRRGSEVIIDPQEGVDEDLIRLPLLGMILATLLQQRGVLTLHASAVDVGGAAVGFMGDRGQGKSTMAAALYARGHPLLADDLLATRMSHCMEPVVLPGYPQFKLLPEAAVASLGDDPNTLPSLAAGYPKRARSASEGFSHEPISLRRLYVLREGPEPAIERLGPREAFLQIMCQSYAGRFYKQSVRGVDAAHHFRQCGDLSNAVAVCWLTRPRALELLPDLGRMVEEDIDAVHDAVSPTFAVAVAGP